MRYYVKSNTTKGRFRVNTDNPKLSTYGIFYLFCLFVFIVLLFIIPGIGGFSGILLGVGIITYSYLHDREYEDRDMITSIKMLCEDGSYASFNLPYNIKAMVRYYTHYKLDFNKWVHAPTKNLIEALAEFTGVYHEGFLNRAWNTQNREVRHFTKWSIELKKAVREGVYTDYAYRNYSVPEFIFDDDVLAFIFLKETYQARVFKWVAVSNLRQILAIKLRVNTLIVKDNKNIDDVNLVKVLNTVSNYQDRYKILIDNPALLGDKPTDSSEALEWMLKTHNICGKF